MAATFDASEVAKLAHDLARESTHVGVRVGVAIRKGAERVRVTAMGLAPSDTGALRSSIEVVRSDTSSAQIGTKIRYSTFQEYGTAKMRASPFMGPALDAETPAFYADLERIVREAVR